MEIGPNLLKVVEIFASLAAFCFFIWMMCRGE